MLTELDRLLGTVGDGDVREAVAARLRSVLSAWQPQPTPQAEEEELESASDDELFDLIQREFGKS